MQETGKLIEGLKDLMHKASTESLDTDAYKEICGKLNVSKMYYDIELGGEDRYRNLATGQLVIADEESDGKIILYDSGEETDLTMTYPYYYEGVEYVHAYIEFPVGVKKEDLDLEIYQMMADVIYILVSRKNMRLMLDFAEIVDPLTGIPNIVFTTRRYSEVTKTVAPEDICVLFVNLRNFKYINESAGAKAGDEAITQYARKVLHFVDRSCESCCRIGGDNFVMFILKEHLDEMIEKLHSVKLADLESAPNQVFKVNCWIGVSEVQPGQTPEPFVARLNEAAAACNMGKTRFKKNVVLFDDELVKMMGQSRRIIALFKPAVKNHEFHPFFQAKVDMNTGKLVGFEALCRWIHEGSFIYPDQFIPVLDKEGLIHDLDMAIFSETCHAIKKWKEMGLTPPRVSSNFSRKNLYVPDIEEKIYSVIQENGLDSGDVEIEITESVKESDYDRLIEYVKTLKNLGIHISIDDFGTGYSSLSLIHNIDADVVKIDKSFVDEITTESKAKILIESIISIAQRLKMSVIAEGVETAEQGRALLDFGCSYAQGYYYSKPVDFETATSLISDPPFLPIASGMA